jgi:hypothetical protein
MDDAARPAHRRLTRRAWPLLGHGLSAALHLGLIAASALARPTLGPTEMAADPIPELRLSYLVFADVAEAETEEAGASSSAGSTQARDNGRGVADARSADGRAGSFESEAAAGRIATGGPPSYPEPTPMQRGREDSTWWSVGPPKGQSGDPKGLETWDRGLGADPHDAQGNLRGPEPVEAIGRSGTTMSGSESGGSLPACVPGAPRERAPMQTTGRPHSGSRGAVPPPNDKKYSKKRTRLVHIGHTAPGCL